MSEQQFEVLVDGKKWSASCAAELNFKMASEIAALEARATAAEAQVARLVAALRRIDAKNDNPACFNPEINVIVMAALEENHNVG